MNSQTAALVERLKAELERHDTLWNEPDKQLWTNVSRITVGDMRVLLAALKIGPIFRTTVSGSSHRRQSQGHFRHTGPRPHQKHR